MPTSPLDRRMIIAAQEVSKRSQDPDRRVGAVIALGEQVISIGANEPPKSLHLDLSASTREIEADSVWKYFFLEHAERNALFGAWVAGHSVEGATMYGTLFPCADCARAIVAAGISRLVVPQQGIAERDHKWAQHYRYSREILRRAGVLVDFWNENDFE